jgi:Domain of unknown function (DUF927)
MPARKRDTSAKKASSRKKTPSRKKLKKLGFKVVVRLPTGGTSRKGDIAILKPDGTTATTDRGDLGDGNERGRLARKLARRFQGEPDQWESALERAYLEAVQQREACLQADLDRPRHPENPENPEFGYQVVGGRICMARERFGEEILIPLCNFNATITDEVCLDDGSGETSLQFTIRGALANGAALPSVTVKALDFTAMHWPLLGWGAKAIVAPGQGSRDHLRAAIQALSTGVVARTIYAHTGWRNFGGTWAYPHAGGAICAPGVELGVSVQLDGPLARFTLPPPPSSEELRVAVRASLGLLRLSRPVMGPILGAVYRSVLGQADCSVHLVGRTGRGKSEVAALGQQHFGAGLDRLHLPGNWLSTGNSLEALAFLAKDAPLVIDDFKPGGSKADIDHLHQLADRVFRAQGNSSGRGRCRADGSLRAPRPPRGLILSSGEDVPRGESLQARQYVIHLGQEQIDLPALTPYQQDAARGLYAAATSAYLCWLAPRYDQVRATPAGERAALRDKAMCASGHPRTPGIVADLALGWQYFLAFATETGAISRVEHGDIAGAVWACLLKGAAEQEADLSSQDQANRFLAFLAAVVASGRGHLANPAGCEPYSEPEAWGWQGRGGDPMPAWSPRGKQLGWIDGDDVYLDPESAFAEAQRLGEEQGDRLAVSQRRLHKRLHERGLLASTEAGRLTTRKALQGRERAVLHLRTSCLSPQKSGVSGENHGHPASAPYETPENPDFRG